MPPSSENDPLTVHTSPTDMGDDVKHFTDSPKESVTKNTFPLSLGRTSVTIPVILSFSVSAGAANRHMAMITRITAAEVSMYLSFRIFIDMRIFLQVY